MKQSHQHEITDSPDLSPDTWKAVRKDLAWTNRVLGNIRALVSFLRTEPTASVLDIGCGDGAILRHIKRALPNITVRGVELYLDTVPISNIPITEANAVSDPLPETDTALAILMIHHLTPQQVQSMVRNVGRYCRRLIILDLVRHPLPLILFSMFIAPLLHPINAADGKLSIRRAYTPKELRTLISDALQDQGASIKHSVHPLRFRQIIDIRYKN